MTIANPPGHRKPASDRPQPAARRSGARSPLVPCGPRPAKCDPPPVVDGDCPRPREGVHYATLGAHRWITGFLGVKQLQLDVLLDEGCCIAHAMSGVRYDLFHALGVRGHDIISDEGLASYAAPGTRVRVVVVHNRRGRAEIEGYLPLCESSDV
jgi:hypothetical protein